MLRNQTIQSEEIAAYARQKIVPEILQSIKPDIIYLLAGTICRRQTESIFSHSTSYPELPNNLTLLILVSDLHHKRICDLQDSIEQRCKGIADILTIVLETQTFMQSLQANQSFFINVVSAATVIYHQIDLPSLGMRDTNTVLNPAEVESCYAVAINKAREFLAGADLFRIRKQYTMAAFMIHQSIEQALMAIVKAGTGYCLNTHSIDRLRRFASLVTPSLENVFSHRKEEDKMLLNLLQKAYVGARYKTDYKVHARDLLLIDQKVRLIHDIAFKVKTCPPSL